MKTPASPSMSLPDLTLETLLTTRFPRTTRTIPRCLKMTARDTRFSKLYFGSTIDSEPEGQPSPLANGDNESSGAEPDGVVAISSVVANTSSPATASFLITSSGAGVVDAWIDMDLDGDWDEDERVLARAPVREGNSILSLKVSRFNGGRSIVCPLPSDKRWDRRADR